jgi:hypothetical protein
MLSDFLEEAVSLIGLNRTEATGPQRAKRETLAVFSIDRVRRSGSLLISWLLMKSR